MERREQTGGGEEVKGNQKSSTNASLSFTDSSIKALRGKLTLSAVLASGGGMGFSPLAPGTVASLFAMLVFLILKPSWQWVLGTVSVLTVVGIIVSDRAEKIAQEPDPSWVVIDEIVGYGVSVLFLPPDLGVGIVAFFFFRFFDIIKPPPVRTVERLMKGGWGVMADDMVAGALTNILLRVGLYLIQ